jgi:Domain of unknown function (DUF4424)
MISAPEAVPGGATIQQAAAAGLMLAAVALLPCMSAAATDSTAELAAGGLILTNSDDIDVRSEELSISPRQVRVRYRFYNGTAHDVKTLVAFPMPDITVADAAANLPLPTDDPENLLGFSTRVDGAPVKAQAVQKVFAHGADRTADLARMKVPLAPHLRTTDKALSRLQPADWEELRRLGLADVEEYSVGRGLRKQLSPRWTLKTTYLWEQTFPAGKEVAIEHSYKPSVGRSAQTVLADPAAFQQPWLKEYFRKYCLDRDFMGAVEQARQTARARNGAPFSEERISYLLSTGANWAKPVGEFRLIVDTGDPANLASLCMDGLRKVSPTRYEVRKTDFLPQADLHILILKRLKGR